MHTAVCWPPLRGRDVARSLSEVLTRRGIPETITVDNGSEFYSREMDTWAYRNGVELDFIRPGKSVTGLGAL